MKEGNIDIMMTQETRMAEGEAKEGKWYRQHPRGMKVFTAENIKEHRKAGEANLPQQEGITASQGQHGLEG